MDTVSHGVRRDALANEEGECGARTARGTSKDRVAPPPAPPPQATVQCRGLKLTHTHTHTPVFLGLDSFASQVRVARRAEGSRSGRAAPLAPSASLGMQKTQQPPPAHSPLGPQPALGSSSLCHHLDNKPLHLLLTSAPGGHIAHPPSGAACRQQRAQGLGRAEAPQGAAGYVTPLAVGRALTAFRGRTTFSGDAYERHMHGG